MVLGLKTKRYTEIATKMNQCCRRRLIGVVVVLVAEAAAAVVRCLSAENQTVY